MSETSLNILNELKGKKLLITGGTGFVGKNLTDAVLKFNESSSAPIDLTILSRNPKSSKYYKSIGIDVSKPFNLKEPFDYVIHAATSASVENQSFLECLEVAINGLQNIFNALAGKKQVNFLLVSSGAVYGAVDSSIDLISETIIFNGPFYDSQNPYGTAKRVSELYALSDLTPSNISVKIARGFAFSGKHLPIDQHFAIGNFIRDGLRNGPIKVKGSGAPLRSYMDAEDMVNWIFTILAKGKAQEIYNLGSDQKIYIKDLAFKVASMFDKVDVVIERPDLIEDTRNQYVPSIKKAKEHLGLNITIGLEESINRMIVFNRENL